MKRFEITKFTEANWKPSKERGFFDKRKLKVAWKYVAINFGYWKFQFNYGKVNVPDDETPTQG